MIKVDIDDVDYRHRCNEQGEEYTEIEITFPDGKIKNFSVWGEIYESDLEDELNEYGYTLK